MITTRLLSTSSILATLALGGCYLQVAEGDINGRPGGDEGSPCDIDTDCEEGLVCDELTCTATEDDPTTCEGGHDAGAGGAGRGAGGAGQGGAGAGDAGRGGALPACIEDADCEAGEICAEDGSCAVPTCEQIDEEASCLERADCETVYAGVDCSCGQGCTCQAGEPGCVCASFEFFRCEALTAAP